MATRELTQTERLLRYLQTHPAASSMEIIAALQLSNATGRLSDLRLMGEREGFEVVKEKRSDGRDGYTVRWLPKQPDLGLTA